MVDAGLALGDDVEHLEIGKVEAVVDPERAPLTIIELEVKDETRSSSKDSG